MWKYLQKCLIHKLTYTSPYVHPIFPYPASSFKLLLVQKQNKKLQRCSDTTDLKWKSFLWCLAPVWLIPQNFPIPILELWTGRPVPQIHKVDGATFLLLERKCEYNGNISRKNSSVWLLELSRAVVMKFNFFFFFFLNIYIELSVNPRMGSSFLSSLMKIRSIN